jgi:hypothetical protein
MFGYKKYKSFRILESLSVSDTDFGMDILNDPKRLTKDPSNTFMAETYVRASGYQKNTYKYTDEISFSHGGKSMGISSTYVNFSNSGKRAKYDSEETFISHGGKDLGIDNDSISAYKDSSYLRGDMDNVFVYKDSVYLRNLSSDVFLTKDGRRTMYNDTFKWINSSIKNANKFDNLFVNTGNSALDIKDEYKSFDRAESYTFIDDDFFISKEELTLNKDTDFSKSLSYNEKNVGIFKIETLEGNPGELSIEEWIKSGYKYDPSVNLLDDSSIGFEKSKSGGLIQESTRLKTSGKKTRLDDDTRSAYSDGILPPIEILKNANDELLLPQDSFDYSSYRDKVFGPNLTINRPYLKGLSGDGNPIINVPIENPVSYYSDIAKNYIDVDVKIMREVLELLYKNWRQNIHRYAGLEPSKAINNILEKTHEELKEFYSSTVNVNRIKHAERSLKLFAWYSEMGILAHSDKEIVYKKAHGVFDLWNKLPQYSYASDVSVKGIELSETLDMDDFYSSQSNPYILSSERGVESVLKLAHVPQMQETLLKFKGYILGSGTIEVIVNGESHYYDQRANDVLLPLSKEDNSITIRFTPGNISSSLDISNFIVEGRYNLDYNLEYTGKVSNVNFTIQYILDFMTIAGDSLDEVQPVLKTTAQLAYALDRFREYMVIHHDKKYKGKRLTMRR